MEVTLIAKTGLTNKVKDLFHSEEYEDSKIIAFTAIRTCYSHLNPLDIFPMEKDKFSRENTNVDSAGKRGADALIKHITKSGHTSTLEHINYTFSISGVSRTLLAQLTRHRHLSYSVQSQRYVTLSSNSKSSGADFFIPDSIVNNPELNEKYLNIVNQIQEAYDELKKLKLPSEDARYLLPNATCCNIVLTGNLRSILEFYSKRNKTTHAQKEIQDLAELMKEEIVSEDTWTKPFFEDLLKAK